MATETSGGSSFEARVLDSISALSSSFDAKLAEFKEQLMEEQKMENDRLTKKLKLEKKFEFRRKGNEIQHAFNEGVKAVVDEVAAILDKHPATGLERAKEALKEGMQLIDERQKLIKIADRSESGWLTAQEYETDEIADDSDDEKRIARAERQAERLKKKRSQSVGRRGRGGRFFRAQPYRQPDTAATARVFDWPVAIQRSSFQPASMGPSRPANTVVCFMCGRAGHIRRECPLQRLAGGAGAASGGGAGSAGK